MKTIQLEPSPSMTYCRFEFTPVAMAPGEPFESSRKLEAKIFGKKELPVIEVNGVFEGKSCEEISPVERHRLTERLQAFRADF